MYTFLTGAYNKHETIRYLNLQNLECHYLNKHHKMKMVVIGSSVQVHLLRVGAGAGSGARGEEHGVGDVGTAVSTLHVYL